jgi:hypothetical protein
MSATKQIRIRSKEGVVLTKNGVYKTTIDIDGYGQSDLARSYLVLKVAFTDATTGNLLVNNENVWLGDLGSGTPYDGQCFIRNCRLTCQQFGVVEENLKINVYHQSLRRFTEGRQVEESRRVFGNELLTTDSNGVANIVVPLSSILGCGNQVYPNDMMGQSTLTLEMEFVLDIAFYEGDVVQSREFSLPTADVNGGDGDELTTLFTTNAFEDLATAQFWFSVGSMYGVQGDVSGVPINEQGIIESVSLDTNNKAIVVFEEPLYTFTEDATFTDGLIFDAGGLQCDDETCDAQGNIYTIQSSDFMTPAPIVGLIYEVGYIGEDGVCRYNSSKLTSYDDSAGVDAFTFAEAIITGQPNEEITGIFIVEKQRFPANWAIQQTDLVLHKLLQEVPMKQFQYETYSVEQTNQPASIQFRKQFQLEADASKFVYMTPLDTLISEQNLSASYRWTLNNIDLTNRNVPIDRNTSGSLYYDRLLMNVDGIQQLDPNPYGSLLATIYPERCPIGQNNMAELMLDGDGSTPMEGCVGHLFKTRVKVLGGK